MSSRFMKLLLCFVFAFSMIFSSVAVPQAAATTPTSGNIYYIKNKNSGMYLTVQGDSSSNGANVVQQKGTGSLGQRWILEKLSSGSFRLHPATDMTGGTSLDVANGSADGGTNIQIWKNNSLSPQNFGITACQDGYVITTEVTSHKSCLDVLNFSTESGANVIQWTNNQSANQIWYFEAAQWPTSGSSSNTTTTTETTTVSTSSSSSGSSSGMAAPATASKSWNFSDSNFRNLRTLSSSVTVDGITLLANSSKTVSVMSAPVDSFTYCLALGGGGSLTYRAVKIPVNGSTTIKVTAKSTGDDTRTLLFVNDSGSQVGKMDCNGQLATGSAVINGNGNIYIYSKAKGINIYKIQVDTSGTVPSGSSSSSSSSSSNNNNSATTPSTSSSTTASTASAVDAGGYPDQLMEFVSSSDGKFVTASGNGVVSSGTSSTANRWKIVNVGNSRYQIINASNGKALAPAGNNATNGATVTTENATSNNAQYWQISAVKNDAVNCGLNYKLINCANSQLGLTLSSSGYKLNGYSGAASQCFRFNSHGAEGFAGYAKTMNGSEKASITGGVLGQVVTVTNLSDLQKYATGSTPYTVVIGANISQSALTKVTVGSNKTFIGKFGSAVLNNIHFRCISNSGNVIFKNITFKHDSDKNENDDIQMYISDGNNFWLDHCTFVGHDHKTDTDVDKHLYVGLKADYVSVTGNYFGGHKYGLILGYPQENGAGTYSGYPRMTIANNYFYNNYTRAPGLMRYGYFHSYNNYVYGFHLGYTPYTGANIYSEKNYFDKGQYAGNVVDDHGVGNFTDSGSVLTTSVSNLKTAQTSWRPISNYSYSTRNANDAKTWAVNYAGAQKSKIVYAID